VEVAICGRQQDLQYTFKMIMVAVSIRTIRKSDIQVNNEEEEENKLDNCNRTLILIILIRRVRNMRQI
jgi:hypothetical protein